MNGVATGVFGDIAKAFGSAAAKAVNWLWRQLDNATSIDITSKGMQRDLYATWAIAALVALSMFVIQVISSALRQDMGGLGRAVRGMLVAFVGAVFAIGTLQLLLAAVDQLCNAVVQYTMGTNIAGLGTKLVAASALTGLDPATMFLFALVLIAAVVMVWGALMIRKMLIIVSAVFAPIAFSGATADVTNGWVNKWIEFTVALVASKLVLVIMFMIGLSVLDGAGSTGGVTNNVTNLAIGSLILLMGGFAPWVAIKMVHFAGDSFHQVHSQAQSAHAGRQAVTSAPQKVANLANTASSMTGVAGKLSGGAGGGTGGANPGGKSGVDPGSAGVSVKPATTPTSGPAGGAAAGGAGAVAAPIAVVQAAKGVAEKAGAAADQARSAASPPATPPSKQ